MSKNLRVVMVVMILLFVVGGMWVGWDRLRGELVCDSYYDFENKPIPCGINRNGSDPAFIRLIGELVALRERGDEVRGVVKISDMMGKALRVPIVVVGVNGGKVGIVNFSSNNASEGQIDAFYDAVSPREFVNKIEKGKEIIMLVNMDPNSTSSCAVESGDALVAYLEEGGIYKYLNYRLRAEICPLRIMQASYY